VFSLTDQSDIAPSRPQRETLYRLATPRGYGNGATFPIMSIGHASLLKFSSTRAAFARTGLAATPFPDVHTPMQPSDSLPHQLRLWFPLPLAYLAASACAGPLGPTTHAPAYVSYVGARAPSLRWTGWHYGEARVSKVWGKSG